VTLLLAWCWQHKQLFEGTIMKKRNILVLTVAFLVAILLVLNGVNILVLPPFVYYLGLCVLFLLFVIYFMQGMTYLDKEVQKFQQLLRSTIAQLREELIKTQKLALAELSHADDELKEKVIVLLTPAIKRAHLPPKLSN
jgi:ABC-type multidrug transport system fused ATPase/permease subunit